MLIPHGGDLVADIHTALAVYAVLERETGARSLSASSGLLVPDRTTEWQLSLLCRAAATVAKANTTVAIGLDHVAAEHLATGSGSYLFEDREYSSARPSLTCCSAWPPGIASSMSRIRSTPPTPAPGRHSCPPPAPRGVTVVGDDLFATDAARARPGLADAMLLKLSQAWHAHRHLGGGKPRPGRGPRPRRLAPIGRD